MGGPSSHLPLKIKYCWCSSVLQFYVTYSTSHTIHISLTHASAYYQWVFRTCANRCLRFVAKWFCLCILCCWVMLWYHKDSSEFTLNIISQAVLVYYYFLLFPFYTASLWLFINSPETALIILKKSEWAISTILGVSTYWLKDQRTQ